MLQRKFINRVCVYLQILLASNLLICKKNAIKYSMRQGMIDKSCTSVFEWILAILCRNDIYYWKRFISSASRSDGLLLNNQQQCVWIKDIEDQYHFCQKIGNTFKQCIKGKLRHGNRSLFPANICRQIRQHAKFSKIEQKQNCRRINIRCSIQFLDWWFQVEYEQMV